MREHEPWLCEHSEQNKANPTRGEGASGGGRLSPGAKRGGGTLDVLDIHFALEDNIFLNNGYTVRIPGGGMPPGWTAPRRFASVATVDTDAWTVQPGDLVVRGLCDTEAAMGISQVTGSEDEWFFATEVHDNLRGAPCGQHVLVTGGF